MQLRSIRFSGRHGAQSGYTLVELAIATGLSLVVLATALSFNRAQLFALRNQAIQLDIQTTARSFLDLFAREVRRTGMDPTCAKTFSAVASASATAIRLQSDLNANGVIDGTNEDVTYAYNLSTNAIERTANGSTDTLVSGLNVSGSRLRYFDGSGNELIGLALTSAQRASVRRVRLELAFQGSGLDPLNSQQLAASFSTDVDLRNRFFVAGTACP